MDLLLKQIEGLILGSIPTVLFFITLVIAYGFLVRRPLDKVLAERRARTSGALEQARGAMNAAEAETAVFEDKLRAAKAEIFQARDKKLKQWASEREQALDEARTATHAKVTAARQEIEASVAAARTQIEGMSEELSSRIMKAVLPPGMTGTEAAQ
jgi:F-type H+-transporting ATPase subunit b